MMIGLNIPEAHLQVEVIEGQKDEPVAVRTALGWSLMGVASCESSAAQEVQASVNLTITRDLEIHESVERFWKTESFGAAYDKKQSSSMDDRKAEHILKETTCLVDGHYQVGMLWKKADCILPNNYAAAEKRFKLLAKRLMHDKDFGIMYSNTLNGYISNGHARKLMQEEIASVSPRTWYIPHHGVTSPNKSGKVRVVFDAAAAYAGTSLNDNLLSGPDLVNNLFGVIQRFRLYQIALMADVEGMFHQVRVFEHDSDSLRFLWKADNQQPGPPDVYKMLVHIFGATDSCSCACYALQQTACDNANEFHPSVIKAVSRDFYVDDLVKSVETVAEAIQMTQDLPNLMQKGGFHLHKWVSNSEKVLAVIPESQKANQPKDFDLDEQPLQRALGLRWNVEQDCFTFNPTHRDVTNTKRAIVSTVCSIFDPCGYLAPFTIRAKFMIQEIWRCGLDWDDTLPIDIQAKWEVWHSELEQLHDFNLPRHHLLFSSQFDHVEVHVFADSSEKGYGAVAYLRYLLNSGTNTCSFLAAKTHVAPLTPQLTIPRLELQGAVLAIRLWVVLKKELDLKIERVLFWTDSNTVLQYLNNETKRFKPFVANRVSEILDSSDCKQWCHVASVDNPADHSTRGLHACSLTQLIHGFMDLNSSGHLKTTGLYMRFQDTHLGMTQKSKANV
ncbi:uncharacterized protein LOC125376895 [Haliotis rufescens]|uniref:uncharacterized protein LOC125376895 n=1 Tax=Haliotis rufescens TaxID=6454 RepID=UPI00201E83ED|nr:uncharacterized protein LOC125376895 [Haliotis rufescens]